MKSVRTFFYSVDNSKNEKIFIDVDETFNKEFDSFNDVFELLERAKAEPSKRVMDKIFSEI